MTLLPPTAPHPHLSPRQLQVASYLYGLDTPNLDTATVLELGCDQGQNLLAFAYSHPLAKAIGIDLDPETISLGQQQLRNKGISNIELHALDLAQLIQTDLPLCDYIIVRGLFAQTDLDTRLQLLNHCRQFLSPNGVIVIQYAVYPGSKALDGVFDSLALHSAQSSEAEPEHQLQALRAMLGFMGEGMSKDSPSTQATQAAITQLEQQNDQELYLSALGGLHHPCYFIEFASQLEAAGLCYVGDADPASELPERISNNAKVLTRVINPSQNKILTQQYVDTLINRSYRYSLVSHSTQAEKITNLPDVKKVIDLHWAGYFQPKSINGQLQNNIFETKTTELLQTSHTISQDTFYALGEAWPYSLNVKTLARHAAPLVEILEDIDNPAAHQQMAGTLEQIFIHSSEHLYLSKQPGPYNALPYKELSTDPLNKLQYGTTTPTYVNLWNEQVTLESNDSKEKNKDLDAISSINSLEDIAYVMDLRKEGLVFSDYKGWEHFYLASIKFLNTQKNTDSTLYITKSLGFIFYQSLFNDQKSTIKKLPNLSNKKFQLAQKIADKELHDLIKNLKKNSFSDDDIAFYFFILSDKKMGTQELDNLDLIKRSIEFDKNNYYYYVSLANLIRLLEIDHNLSYWLSRKLVAIDNKNPYLISNIAKLYANNNNLEKSEKTYKVAIKINSSDTTNINNLALVLSKQGRTEEAINQYETIINALDFTSYSNYLFTLIHSNRYDEKEIFQLHRAYGEKVEKWAAEQNWTPKPFEPHSNRPLRIGFVSGDLRNHAVAKFLLPYWEGLNKEQFHIYAYYSVKGHDHYTQRFKERAEKWTDVYPLNDLELAKTIREDEIDILIDLSGHTGHNRLPAFALKPAPVQITWIGYPATTGLKAMDYYLTYTDYLALPELPNLFTEQLLYLDLDYPFDNSIDLPAITEQLPTLKNGYFTFGSFNRPQKISDKVLKTWAELMQLCLNDKLLVANLPDKETRAKFKDKLIRFGAKEEQLILKERVSLDEYLEMHNEVDLLLDTFPYAGGTTAFHAISMGVATISLAGKSMFDYQPLFPSCGLQDFMASNTENYKAKALYWKDNTNVLLELRHSLRSRLDHSEKEADNPVRVFERGLTYAWDNYLECNEAKSFLVK